MELLQSNYQPLKTDYARFIDKFQELVPNSTRIDIAVGYVSSESLLELYRIIELNKNIQKLNLIIGMHYFDKFTKLQYESAMKLNQFLYEEKRGEVRLAHKFRYHGKMYTYSGHDGAYAGIIGSNNLSCIVDGGTRQYESAVFLNDVDLARKMLEFLENLSKQATINISEYVPGNDFAENESIFNNINLVKKLDKNQMVEIGKQLSDISIEIPLGTAPKSNLNCYHGAGRKNFRTGLEKPRHWYEVELIVPVNIRREVHYPKGTPKGEQDNIFNVYTDDGYTFKCYVGGGNEEGLWNKNLRSYKDLTILGKWIKGRLEGKNALSVGDYVTEETFKKYGRSNITMTKFKDSDDWYFDFSGVE